jgi:glucosamine kinase
MNLYLGLDVGGTKTAAMLADDTHVLATAEAGSIKTLRLPEEEAMRNLVAVITALEGRSGRTIRGNVVRTCVGTSGVSAPGVRSWMHAAFAETVGGEFLLVGDEVIGLDAAFPGGRGVLVIAGTGSNIVSRASDGRMAHSGGWGPALADEGSGHWIGTEALRACFRAIDAAPPSSADAVLPDRAAPSADPADLPPLLVRFLDLLGLPAQHDIIGAANAPGFHTAALVPAVVAANAAGDPIAARTLHRAGSDLAQLVHAAIRKAATFEADATLPPPEVAFVGSILTHIAAVRDAMTAELQGLYPGIVVRQTPEDPLLGAIWHARGRR